MTARHVGAGDVDGAARGDHGVGLQRRPSRARGAQAPINKFPRPDPRRDHRVAGAAGRRVPQAGRRPDRACRRGNTSASRREAEALPERPARHGRRRRVRHRRRDGGGAARHVPARRRCRSTTSCSSWRSPSSRPRCSASPRRARRAVASTSTARPVSSGARSPRTCRRRSPAGYPPCRIGRRAAGSTNEGPAACARCPLIVTTDYRPSEELRQAADPAGRGRDLTRPHDVACRSRVARRPRPGPILEACPRARQRPACPRDSAGVDPPPAWPPSRCRPADLDRPLDTLPGVGKTIRARLAKLGLRTVRDLVEHAPFRYVGARPISSLFGEVDEVSIEGTVGRVRSGCRAAPPDDRRGDDLRRLGPDPRDVVQPAVGRRAASRGIARAADRDAPPRRVRGPRARAGVARTPSSCRSIPQART